MSQPEAACAKRAKVVWVVLLALHVSDRGANFFV
jgi:hypothetical protein